MAAKTDRLKDLLLGLVNGEGVTKEWGRAIKGAEDSQEREEK